MNIKIATVLLSLACCSVNFSNAHLPPGVIYYGTSSVASQSSTWPDPSNPIPTAEKAFDGNTNGDYHEGSVAHTDNDNDPSWWEVKLDSSQQVTGVKIWNRIGPTSDRLVGFVLKLFQDDCQGVQGSTPVYTYNDDTGGPGEVSYEIDFTNMGTPESAKGIPADYIRIELPGSEYLQLAEVQVYVAHKTPKGNLSTCNAKNPVPPPQAKGPKRKRRLVKTRD